MPTGSLAPDSPSSSTPVRPAISRRPNTENTTAGSVAATAVPTSRARCQLMPATYRAATAVPAAVTSVPAVPVQMMARRGGAEPLPADVHAAVEQDDRERHRDDPLHGLHRQRRGARPELRRDDGRDEEERGRRHPEPRAEPVGQHGRGPGQPDHQDDEAELGLPAHRRVREVVTSRTLPGQDAVEENWEKLKNDFGSSMFDTLNDAGSRPNWYMTFATRWIRVSSTPIG